jgi:peptide/nickel transport system permease protein
MTRGRIAIALLVAFGLVALLAPMLMTASPDVIDLAHRRSPPSLGNWFGTDELGRDLFTRVVFGARVSLAVGVLSAAVAGALGIAVGAIAGTARGAVDGILMRITDAALSVPRLLLLMAACVVLRPSVPLLVLLVGGIGWMETARVTRAAFLAHRDREFVLAARASGASPIRLMWSHLLPNAAGPIVVSMTLAVGRGILLESALSFFGVGVQPPTASWGNMLYQAQTTMSTEPWLALFPGLFIFGTSVAINMMGDSLSGAGAMRRPR